MEEVPVSAYPSRHTESRSDSSSDLQCRGIPLRAQRQTSPSLPAQELSGFLLQSARDTHHHLRMRQIKVHSACAGGYVHILQHLHWVGLAFCSLLDTSTRRVLERCDPRQEAFRAHLTEIEGKACWAQGNDLTELTNFNGGTREETSRTRSGMLPVNRSWSERLLVEGLAKGRLSARVTCPLSPKHGSVVKPRRCLWWLQSTRSHTRHTYRLFSCSGACSEILQLMVLHPQALPKPASHPSTRGTPGIPLSGPVPVCIPKPIWPLVTAVICAALHPVRRASCTSKIFLSFYWTCFSFGCAQRIRKKLAQLRRGGPQSQCKYRATFSISTSSMSRSETSSPRFNSTCHFLARGDFAHRKHPEASQRRLSFCRASNSKGGLLKHMM